MDLVNSIASMSMSMSAASLQQEASLSIQKKAMEAQEQVGEELLKMLPPQNSIIDTYA